MEESKKAIELVSYLEDFHKSFKEGCDPCGNEIDKIIYEAYDNGFDRGLEYAILKIKSVFNLTQS